MPTGYTADVGTRDDLTFPEFALRCARAFGALVELRDEPDSAPIPERLKGVGAVPHHTERIAKAQARLAELTAMRPDEIKRDAAAHYACASQEYDDRELRRRAQKARYERMLAQVRAWTPPTPEHVELRKFMEDQLVESIQFDCMPLELPPSPSPGAWHAKAIADAKWSVEYHAKCLVEGQARDVERQAWLDALRESLRTA